ncbi:uncharacterized protein B0H64DRAFT_464311 [Chaetomium fimeti]|uniref:Uncharacterized protein n=1 Tax=Chaetomium fimeti TaxID=1854472 RepID=A0AAE0HEJ5_9PEZI|nr:hypothetical protein B0H64DRAFT_464311 [Chaetomium fimeti]
MGAKFSKVSCSCTINCHQHPAVHDHSNGVGPCQRCTHLRRLRAGTESRASAASTSTEYLARPRHYASPSPDSDLARHLLLNSALLRQRTATAQRRARHNRAISYPEDTLPSLSSTTTGPSLSPNPSPSLSSSSTSTILNRTPSLPSSAMRAAAAAAASPAYTRGRHASDADESTRSSPDGGGHMDRDDGPASRSGAVQVEICAPTPSDISRSSTVVGWHGSEERGSEEGETESLARTSLYSGEGEDGEGESAGFGLEGEDT